MSWPWGPPTRITGIPSARKYLASELEVLAGLVAEGKLNPMINRVATLEEAPEALAEVGARHVQGKIVIDLS